MQKQAVLPLSKKIISKKVIGYDDEHKAYTQESDPLALYLKQISTYPLLISTEEKEIGRKISVLSAKLETLKSSQRKYRRKNMEYKKEKARLERLLTIQKNKMINSNLRLVVSIAKQYQHRGLSLLDLIDEGNIDLTN